MPCGNDALQRATRQILRGSCCISEEKSSDQTSAGLRHAVARQELQSNGYSAIGVVAVGIMFREGLHRWRGAALSRFRGRSPFARDHRSRRNLPRCELASAVALKTCKRDAGGTADRSEDTTSEL